MDEIEHINEIAKETILTRGEALDIYDLTNDWNKVKEWAFIASCGFAVWRLKKAIRKNVDSKAISEYIKSYHDEVPQKEIEESGLGTIFRGFQEIIK